MLSTRVSLGFGIIGPVSSPISRVRSVSPFRVLRMLVLQNLEPFLFIFLFLHLFIVSSVYEPFNRKFKFIPTPILFTSIYGSSSISPSEIIYLLLDLFLFVIRYSILSIDNCDEVNRWEAAVPSSRNNRVAQTGVSSGDVDTVKSKVVAAVSSSSIFFVWNLHLPAIPVIHFWEAGSRARGRISIGLELLLIFEQVYYHLPQLSFSLHLIHD